MIKACYRCKYYLLSFPSFLREKDEENDCNCELGKDYNNPWATCEEFELRYKKGICGSCRYYAQNNKNIYMPNENILRCLYYPPVGPDGNYTIENLICTKWKAIQKEVAND